MYEYMYIFVYADCLNGKRKTYTCRMILLPYNHYYLKEYYISWNFLLE